MIIIKPDLVIKWANSNLVLHRVREHLCVFPVSPHIFTFLNILVMVLVSLNIYMRCACVCVCVCQGKVLQRKCTYWKCLFGHGDCYHLSSCKEKKRRQKKKTHTQTLPHPFFLYLALTLFSSLPLSFCITYKGSRFLQNEATYGRYANEIIARGLEWDTIYPKSWLSIMAGD